jgi:hypothetical protein
VGSGRRTAAGVDELLDQKRAEALEEEPEVEKLQK